MTSSPQAPWNQADSLPARPPEGEFGYLDENEQPVTTSREELIAAFQKGEEIWYVWTPQAETCVPPAEVDFLAPLLQAGEKESSRKMMLKGGIATLIGGALLVPFWGTPNGMVLVMLIFLFGLFPLLYGFFLQRRSSDDEGPEDRRKEARFEYWLEKQYGSMTYTLIGLLVIVFVFQLMIGIGDSIGRLGVSTETIRGGDWWRLLTAILAHGHIPHLVVNSYAIYFLGQRLEILAGRDKFVLVFLAAGISGAVASYLFNHPASLSVGASGGICGLLGFLFILYYRNRSVLSRSFLWPLVMGAIGLAGIGLLVPNIDNSGHVGGFLAGLVLGAVLSPHLDRAVRPSPTIRILGYGSSLLILIGVTGAITVLLS